MRFLTGILFAALAASSVTYAQKNDGQAIFQQACVGCHGPDGKAATDTGKRLQAADLTASDIQQKSDSELAKTVKSGKGKMPAWEGKLSDDEIKAVVGYVKELGKSK
jgi:cytochrome c6